MRKHNIVFISVVVLLAFIHILMVYMQQTSIDSQVALIVLKLPRTGSSWFTQILNSAPRVFISKEIVQSADSNRFTARNKAMHIHRALIKPTDKLSRSTHILPSSRFMEDFILHPTYKILSLLEVVGITLNPEHVQGMQWEIALRTVKNIRLVLYERSNYLKTALSAMRGEEQKRQCGVANMRANRPDCALNTTMHVAIDTLLDTTYYWQKRYENFHHMISQDPVLHRVPKLRIYYEDLQVSVSNTLKKLVLFLHTDDAHLESTGLRYIASKSSSSSNSGASSSSSGTSKIIVSSTDTTSTSDSSSSSSWVKRTSDDLSILLSNYIEIKKQLSLYPECAFVLAMLVDQAHTIFTNDKYIQIPETTLICKEKILNK